MNTTQTIATGTRIGATVHRWYRTAQDLDLVLDAILDAEVEICDFHCFQTGVAVTLHVTVKDEETWTADVELEYPGLDDHNMGYAFADAVLDEAALFSVSEVRAP